MKVWCVQHRTGWCAVKGNASFAEVDFLTSTAIDNVPTECDHFVIMPWGIVEREPTCKICREKLGLKGE